MSAQSKKDNREEKELKGMVMTMATYIDSLMNLGALLVLQAPQAFDLNSIGSQQLVNHYQML